MAVVVGTLTIDLRANTASFSQAMDKASNLAAKSASDIKRSLEKIAAAGIAMSAAVAGATVGILKHAFDAADAMGKMAQATGTTTETLSRLQYAASLSNVENEALAGGLERLARSALAAKTGNQELANLFGNVLKVSITGANGQLKDSGVLMSELALKFARMGESAGKTGLAMTLFGKSGAQLLPLLNQYGEDQAAVNEEAEKFGLILGSKTAAVAGAAHDNLDRLHAAVKGFGLTLFASALPAIEKLTNDLVAMAKSAELPNLASKFGSGVETAIRAIGNALQFAVAHATALKVALEALAAVQLSKIAIPLLADLATGGLAAAPAGIKKFGDALFGLGKVGPALEKLGAQLLKTSELYIITARGADYSTIASVALEVYVKRVAKAFESLRALQPAAIFTSLGSTLQKIPAFFSLIVTAANNASKALFLAALSNPWTAAAAAITGVIAVLYAFRNATFTLKGTTYELRDVWNGVWIEMGKAITFLGQKFMDYVNWLKRFWTGFLEWFGGQSFVKKLGEWFDIAVAFAQKWGSKIGGALTPKWLLEGMDEARRRRLEDAKKKPDTGDTPGATPKPTLDPDLGKLGKKKDPYKDEIEKLDQAIAAERAYLKVLDAEPAEIERVASAEKARALVIDLNRKLREEGKAELSQAQQARLAEKVALADSLKSLRDYGTELVGQQRQAQLAIEQSKRMAAAVLEGDEAVRVATLDNAELALKFGKSADAVAKMSEELKKLRALLDRKSKTEIVENANRERASIEDRIAAQKAVLAVLGEGEQAYREAALAAQTFALTQKIASMGAGEAREALEKQRAALEASIRQEWAERDARDLTGLRDEARLRTALTGALLDGEEAYRQASLAAKLATVDRDIANAKDEETKGRLRELREAVEAATKAEWAEADARAALALRSPAALYDEEIRAIDRATAALTRNGTARLSWGEAARIAAVRQDALNRALEGTIDLLLRQGRAGDGVKAFFLKMQEQAMTAAAIIYQALTDTFDKVSDELSKLIATGKADFGRMFQEIGQQMLKNTIQSTLQRGLGALGKLFGIKLPGAKADGSQGNPFYVVPVGAGLGLPTTSPAKSPLPTDGLKLPKLPDFKGIFGGLANGLGGIFKSLGGIFGKLFGGAGLFGFLGGLIPHADGGSMSPANAYLVGERGPEILTRTSGRMFSNADSARILGTGKDQPVYQIGTIDARGTDPALTEQRTRSAILAAHQSAIQTSVRLQEERARRMPPQK